MKAIHLFPLLIAALVMLVLLAPNLIKDLGARVSDTLFSYMGRSGLVLFAEADSRQKTLIAAGTKIDHTSKGHPQCVVFHSPAAFAWAQNDTMGSGQRIPAGSRILPNSIASHGAFGALVTMNVGLRYFSDGTVINAAAIASAVDVSAAARPALNNGTMVVDGIDSVTTVDAEPYITLAGANPTDNAQIEVVIWYLPPG